MCTLESENKNVHKAIRAASLALSLSRVFGQTAIKSAFTVSAILFDSFFLVLPSALAALALAVAYALAIAFIAFSAFRASLALTQKRL